MTYLEYAIRLELRRQELTDMYGPHQAQRVIVHALAMFKAGHP